MNINGRDCDSYQVTVTGPSGHKQGWKLEFMLLIGRTLAVLINPIPVTHLLDQSKPVLEHRNCSSGNQFDTYLTKIGLKDGEEDLYSYFWA